MTVFQTLHVTVFQSLHVTGQSLHVTGQSLHVTGQSLHVTVFQSLHVTVFQSLHVTVFQSFHVTGVIMPWLRLVVWEIGWGRQCGNSRERQIRNLSFSRPVACSLPELSFLCKLLSVINFCRPCDGLRQI